MTPLEWTDSARSLRDSLASAWQIRAIEPVSVVAQRHLYLSPEYSATPGYVDFERYPYLREPADRLSPDDACRTVVFLGPIQGGKTIIGQAFLSSIVVQAPGPVLWVTDTDGKAEGFSKKRLDLMIRDDPTLRDLFGDAKSRNKDNTIKFKTFPGGDVKLVGAQSVTGLTSDTIRYAIIDEADDHRANVSYAGSSTELAMGRQTSYGQLAKTLIVSSPKIKGDSDIESWFLRGNQAFFWVPCPYCGEFQRLTWRDEATKEYRLLWPRGHPEEARYFCEHCGVGLEDHEKNTMLPAGEWRPEHPDVADIASYRISALYLPVGSYSWVDMARQWDAATAELKTGATDKHRTFINTRLAETYEVPGDVIDAHTLSRRVEPSWGAAIPNGVRSITVGVDVQDDRVEALVLGVGLGFEMWILDYRIILSDPLAAETWASLDKIVRSSYTREDGKVLRPRATCVDSGHRTQQVYDYAYTRGRGGWRVYAIKGVGGKRPLWDKKVRRSPGKRGRKHGIFYAVGVDTAKDTMRGYLRVHQHGPGYVHIPDHVIKAVPDFLDQLSSEKRVKTRDKKGRDVWTWQKIAEAARNEAWDTLGYAIAAVHSLILGGLRLGAGGSARPGAKKKEKTADVTPPRQEYPRADVAPVPPRPAGTSPPRRRAPTPKGRGRSGWG